MFTFSIAGHKMRRVKALDSLEAAETFARRLAVKHYGKKGYCRTMRADSWAIDGTSATYQAFIGYTPKGGGTNGHNVYITVCKED